MCSGRAARSSSSRGTRTSTRCSALSASSPLVEVNHIVWKYPFGVWTTRKFVSSHYHVLYWAKPGGARTFNLEARYGLAERGADGGSLNYLDREDVWTLGREYKPGRAKNRNELPMALLEKIVQYASNEGDLVCDLFFGGGSTARAAIGLNRRFVGFEVSDAIFAARVPELAALVPGERLAALRRPVVASVPNRGRAWTHGRGDRAPRRLRPVPPGRARQRRDSRPALQRVRARALRHREAVEGCLAPGELEHDLRERLAPSRVGHQRIGRGPRLGSRPDRGCPGRRRRRSRRTARRPRATLARVPTRPSAPPRARSRARHR